MNPTRRAARTIRAFLTSEEFPVSLVAALLLGFGPFLVYLHTGAVSLAALVLGATALVFSLGIGLGARSARPTQRPTESPEDPR